jgi:putative peptide maturation dehydrogenase
MACRRYEEERLTSEIADEPTERAINLSGAQIRRAHDIFISFEDGAFLDFDQLEQGRIAFSPTQLVAASPLAGRAYPVSSRVVEVLRDIPSSDWMDAQALVQRESISWTLLEDLSQKGLIVVSGVDDAHLGAWREQDESLAITWNKYSRLAHFATKWEDVKVRHPGQSDTTDAEFLDSLDDRWETFLEAFGKPPSHFHSIPRPIESYELPLVRPDGELYEVLSRRKTARVFDNTKELTSEQLAILLYWSWGCHGYWPVHGDIIGIKKTSPSGGGLHPIEVYPVIRAVQGMTPGIYHYNVENHRLDQISPFSDDEVKEVMEEFAAGQTWFSGAHVMFVMTARFSRNFWKYRRHPRAYGVLLMDAAHLSQSCYLVATQLGLGAFVTAAINGANIERRLGIDGTEEGAIAVCGCGWQGVDEIELEPEYRPYIPRKTQIETQSPEG